VGLGIFSRLTTPVPYGMSDAQLTPGAWDHLVETELFNREFPTIAAAALR